MNNAQNPFQVHIDGTAYNCPSTTTGLHLYELGKLGPHTDLFKEIQGGHEDQLVARNETEIHVTRDEHFYSEKEFKIAINGREKVVTKPVLTFSDLVALSSDNPPSGPDVKFTITYRNGPHINPQGELESREKVKVKNGMVFNVVPTNKS